MPFLKVARTDDFDGVSSKTVSVLGRKIAIHKSAEGAYRAMEASCRHQNADLTGAPRLGNVVTCPRHGWQYDVTTGECLTESWAALRTYELRIEGNVISVGIGGEAG